jgi:hypothetical protein
MFTCASSTTDCAVQAHTLTEDFTRFLLETDQNHYCDNTTAETETVSPIIFTRNAAAWLQVHTVVVSISILSIQISHC